MYKFKQFERRTVAAFLSIPSQMHDDLLERTCKLMKARFQRHEANTLVNELHLKVGISKTKALGWLSDREEDTANDIGYIHEMRTWLQDFTISYNEVSNAYTIVRGPNTYSLEELMLMGKNAGFSASDLRIMLNPRNANFSVVDSINPVSEMFRQLSKNYKGIPQINTLINCIPQLVPVHKLIYKWFVRAAGQAFGHANEVMLLWVDGVGGSGKSWLNLWLFSHPELFPYTHRIAENESFLDFKGLGKSMFAVDWDELPLSKKRYLSFKSNIAATSGKIYDKKSRTYVPYKRMTNYIGSTNKSNSHGQPGYLQEPDQAMMRRILPVEIPGKIDYMKYLAEVDLAQLWGEAATAFLHAQQSGNKSLLSWEEDQDALRNLNMKYVNSNHSGLLHELKVMFPPATKGNGSVLSASEMLAKLNGHAKHLTPRELGHMLSRMGYIQGRRGNARGWWVKC